MVTLPFAPTEVKPLKPWKASVGQVAINISIVLGSMILAPVIVVLTPLSGKLGTAFIFLVLSFLHS